MSHCCSECLSVLHSASSVESNIVNNHLLSRKSLILCKDQYRKARFMSYLFPTDWWSEWCHKEDKDRGKPRQRETRQTAGERQRRDREGSDKVNGVTLYIKKLQSSSGLSSRSWLMFSKINCTCIKLLWAAITYHKSHRKGGSQQRLACRVFVCFLWRSISCGNLFRPVRNNDFVSQMIPMCVSVFSVFSCISNVSDSL